MIACYATIGLRRGKKENVCKWMHKQVKSQITKMESNFKAIHPSLITNGMTLSLHCPSLHCPSSHL